MYAATGSGLSVLSGRLSYVLGLHGSCLTIDTACSAALAACHAASRALQKSECSRAVAGAVNLMLSPTPSSRFAVAGMTSPHGRSHTFDHRADGYSRADACCGVALGLQQKAGFVLLRGSCVRQDGRSASLTAPNGQAQQGLLTAALQDAALSPDHLRVGEAHGTGGIGRGRHQAQVGAARARHGSALLPPAHESGGGGGVCVHFQSPLRL